MYISILDYVDGKVIIVEVDDSIDVEDYVSEEFGLDNVAYMSVATLKLEINK